MSATIKEIGGRTFAFGTLSAVEALKVQRTLARLLGPVIQTAKGMFGSGKPEDLNKLTPADLTKLGANLVPILEETAERLTDDELVAFIERMLKPVSVGDGTNPARPVNLNMDFTGKPRDLWVVVAESVMVNFRDFFRGSRSPSGQPTG